LEEEEINTKILLERTWKTPFGLA